MILFRKRLRIIGICLFVLVFLIVVGFVYIHLYPYSFTGLQYIGSDKKGFIVVDFSNTPLGKFPGTYSIPVGTKLSSGAFLPPSISKHVYDAKEDIEIWSRIMVEKYVWSSMNPSSPHSGKVYVYDKKTKKSELVPIRVVSVTDEYIIGYQEKGEARVPAVFSLKGNMFLDLTLLEPFINVDIVYWNNKLYFQINDDRFGIYKVLNFTRPVRLMSYDLIENSLTEVKRLPRWSEMYQDGNDNSLYFKIKKWCFECNVYYYYQMKLR